MTEIMSSTTRKTAVLAQIASIGDAGGTLDAIVVNGRVYSGPTALLRAVENFTTRELDELQPQLDREEDRLAERDQRDREREAREATRRREDPLAGVDRERAEAAAAAEAYARSDAGRRDTIIALLERIATAVEKR
jgi:hypothetical protein